MIKLIDLIRELRDPSSEDSPYYKFRDGSPYVKNIKIRDDYQQTYYEYHFQNSNGTGMEITINIQELQDGANIQDAIKRTPSLEYAPSAYISFGLDESNAPDYDEDNDQEDYKWNTLTKAKDLYKIIATIDRAFKDAIVKHYKSDGMKKLKSIIFAPSDDKRKRIYEYYIKNFYSNFEKLEVSSSFEIYINKNYVNELYQFGDREQPPYSRFDTAREDVHQDGTLFRFSSNKLREIEIEPKKWVDVDLKDTSKIDDKTMEDIFELYRKTYTEEGLDLSANSAEEMRGKYNALKMEDVDGDKQPDCFIIYNKVPGYGNKISLLFTNRKPGAARAVITKVIELVNTKGWFIEASKKMEDLMKSSNAPVIRDEEAIKNIIGKGKASSIKFTGDGYYERILSGVDKRIIKRMYGKL